MHLAARADFIRHGRLSRAAIDDESACHRGAEICGGQAQHVGIDVDALSVAQRECSRCRRALCNYHHKARASHRQQHQNFAPADPGQPNGRQSARDRTDDRDAQFSQVQRMACRDRHHHRKQRQGPARREAIAKQNGDRHQTRERERQKVRVPEARADLPQLHQRVAGSCDDAEHIAEHCNADLETDAGQKSDEYRSRQKIGQEPQLENPCQQ